MKRIHVRYHLAFDEEVRETVERVHRMHHRKCPVYRSIVDSIEVTTELEAA